jgi:hypothetical protein
MLEAASNTIETAVEASQNARYGFWGTIALQVGPAFVDTAWTDAMVQVAQATGCETWEVRAFLDSRYGRHFADDVSNEFARVGSVQRAIEEVVGRWMKRQVDERTRANFGIPRGVPYLTAVVVTEGMAAGED